MSEEPILSPFDVIPLSVGQFLDVVNIALRGSPASVYGEVVEVKESSKWVSFTLKDKEEEAILKCVLGVWQYRRIGVRLEDGMEIRVKGNPSISKRFGSFGFWVEEIEPLGEGSLKRAYELLQKQLAMEGLFNRKRALSEFVRSVVVITSRDGVVIQDFKKNLIKRGIKVSLLDTRVEGQSAVPGLLSCIEFVSKTDGRFDVLVVMRGGGSLESMQAFNNEAVVRALFAVPIPTVAAIGHDVNVPLVAMVADREVSTPTAAAIALNQSWDRLSIGLPVLASKIVERYAVSLPKERVERAVERMLTRFGAVLSNFSHHGTLYASRIMNAYSRLFQEVNKLEHALLRCADRLGNAIIRANDSVSRVSRLLTLADPGRNLRLGYSIIFDSGGKVLKSIESVRKGDTLRSKLSDGEVSGTVDEILGER
ncbi:MAG: exodeoxyribonuclease VII large subunit [Candidatus Vogelbacteria bacterium CG10_big_fil_rev_8_21_14_0_10_45_14]|uniref:Exodeoxyribonuclease 7 large subunit n=1 Tax=Candidatus Vogelbacteria bacterium CG10_big_fil_rev_8_21_14_0_10_45_14 TaxID=1975042 RepID=A0A2H0RKI1_9BACT|nr:MAG: exodeoxyribonuclease VII large subunit [Candidatus Vogelbacteria bacterium CG10_big_fil_rev_8_21_14_0_10_45_14]